MIANDVLRSLRYMLDLADQHVIALVRMVDADFPIEQEDVRRMLLREDDPAYLVCDDGVLARVLDGLIVHQRGRDDRLPPRPFETRLGNNMILKKLRVAFELTEVDMLAVFAAAGFPISKPELSALFRQPDHRNFRACGDQVLRNFLKGLTLRVRGG